MSKQVEIIAFGDIVEDNGKTIRENNAALPHNVPLGTKLRIPHPVPGNENGDDEGHEIFMPGIVGEVACYVVRHNRDCDGTPLYILSPYNQCKYGDDATLWDWMDTLNLNHPMAQAMVASHCLSGAYGEEFITRFIVEDDDASPDP